MLPSSESAAHVVAPQPPSSESESRSAAETVEGAALSLQGVDNIESCHSLSLGMLCVGDRVANDILQEGPKHVPGLLVDEGGDTLDSSAASQPTNRWLSDAQDSLLEGLLCVTLGSDLSVALADFASACHVCVCEVELRCYDYKLNRPAFIVLLIMYLGSDWTKVDNRLD